MHTLIHSRVHDLSLVLCYNMITILLHQTPLITLSNTLNNQLQLGK
jgi:hypothetical protein